MLIYPAIDLRGGRVVRLTQGDYDQMTVYELDASDVAKSYVQAGATCLHAVDLDGAKDGRPQNREVIKALCEQPLFVEVGGGMRDEKAVAETLALGAGRVILGTAAVEDFAFTTRMGQKYGDKLAVGVDAKNGFVATHGWRNVTNIDCFDFCRRLVDVGISTVIFTDVSKDGLLSGTNLQAYEKLAAIKGLRVIASGGISYESEIAALRDMGVYGAIVGKALYSGVMTLSRVLSIARGEEKPC